MSTGIQVSPQTAITIGLTPIVNGTNNQVLFQNAGVVSEDANFTYDSALKRLTLKASGTTISDVPIRIRNSADTADLFVLAGTKAFNLCDTATFDGTDFRVDTNAITRMFVSNGGNIGIGTISPTARMHIQAQGALSTDIAFRIRNSADTLDIIRANGAGDVFVGLGAGRVNTGTDNSFLGVNAGFNNTTGNSNTANGASALRSNTTGANNTAQGLNSGRFIADGTTANVITNNSVYLGQNTKALANNQTNQIVIGDSATGLGSNTAVLGNDSITLTGLKGNVAIGATTASARLDVRAQGALSTDVAFRVRNSADTQNLFSSNGNGEFFASSNGNARNFYFNSTNANSTLLSGSNVVINSDVTGGTLRPWNVLLNATDATGSFAGGLVKINTDSTHNTLIYIGRKDHISGYGNFSGSIHVGAGQTIIGNNVNIGTGSLAIGTNINWQGGGSSTGIFAIGSSLPNLVNGYANAMAFGINQVDFVIGGGKGNIGVNYNPTGRNETNTIFVNSGTAPTTSIIDGFQQYSTDITSGNAAPHFRTENGSVIKLYKETTAVTAATLTSNLGTILTDTDTFDGYTMKQVVKALRNMGILA